MLRNKLDDPSLYTMTSFKKFQTLTASFLLLTLLFSVLCTVFIILGSSNKSNCGLATACMFLTRMAIYTMPILIGSFMFYVVDYHKAFLVSISSKNTDSSIETVAKVFNMRRKEMRERGAEERAMDRQDYDELCN